ncbi:MAG: inositol monophosphatase [Chloroflexi bacterium]|nr:inositol monophosphatase [Chloroflexota bacterium]
MSNEPDTPQLSQLISWAKEAGRILRDMQDGELNTRHKSKADLVTAADMASEAYLLGEIGKAFPTHTINAEESGEHQGDSDHRWYIDPLDGTLNYAHGLRIYSVSIAYAFKGELKLGVIYDPSLDECFSAEAGKGAWLNGKPIRPSTIDQMIDAMLITGFRFQFFNTPRSNLPYFNRVMLEAQCVRRLGSAALDLAYVANGRVEGFWEIALNPWDVAAGILICREAGVRVEPLWGEGDLLSGTPDIIAANQAIFPQLDAILRAERFAQGL